MVVLVVAVGLVDAVGLEVEWVEPVAASYEGGGSSGTGEGASGKGVLLGILNCLRRPRRRPRVGLRPLDSR